jgi:hypothetical protein
VIIRGCSWIWLGLLLGGSVAPKSWAQDFDEESTVPSQNLQVGAEVYPWSMLGVRGYMRELANRQPSSLYQAMLPEWRILESKHNRAFYAAAGLGGASLGVLAYSVLSKKLGDANKDDTESVQTRYGSIAIGLAGAAMFSYWWLGPDHRDLENFRIKHNQEADKLSQPAMQLSWGIGPQLSLTSQF